MAEDRAPEAPASEVSIPGALFSEEAIQDAHRHLHVAAGGHVDDEGRVECLALSLGVGMENCRFLTDVRRALAAPAVRREVEALRLAAAQSGTAAARELEAAFAERARLDAALEAAERRIAAALVECDAHDADYTADGCGCPGDIDRIRAALAGERNEAPDG